MILLLGLHMLSICASETHDAISLSVCAYRRRKSVRDKVRETSRGMLILSSHYLDRRAFKFITVIHVDVEYIKTTDTATI